MLQYRSKYVSQIKLVLAAFSIVFCGRASYLEALKTDKPRRHLPFVARGTYFTFSRRDHLSAYHARVQINSGDGVGFVFKHISQGEILFKTNDLLRTSLLAEATVGAQRSVKIMG